MADEQDQVELDLNPDGGLTTLVDLRLPLVQLSDTGTSLPPVVRDANDLRLERMLRREHLFQGIPTPFVGRRDQLEVIYNTVRASVNDQHLRTIEVFGAPGLGKTRLLAEMFAIIDPLRRGINVLASSCSESEPPDGLGILSQLLRRRFQITSADTDDEAHDKILDGIEPLVAARFLSTAARLLSYLAGVRSPGTTTLDERLEDLVRFQRRALKTFFNLLRYDAGLAPQVLVFHRTDHLTVRAAGVLAQLIGELGDTALTLIFLGSRSPAEKIGRFADDHVSIGLEPLPHGDVDRLVRALLQKVDEPPQRLIDDVIANSAGNPGLVEDNLRLLIQRGALEPGEKRWQVHAGRMGPAAPLAATVDDASAARVDALGPKLRAVLEMASVFGPAFWFSGLLALMRTQAYDGDKQLVPWVSDRQEQRLNKLLLEARRAELVVFHTQTAIDGQVEFSFVRRADRARLYDGMPEARRQQYHRMVAQWFEHLTLADPRAWEEVLAGHWDLGRRPGEAARRYLHAGRAAREGYDLERARDVYRRGISLIDIDRADVLVELLECLGDVVFDTGDFAEARRVYGALLEATLINERQAAGAAAWLRLGRAHRGLADYARARPCFKHALKLARVLDDGPAIADALDELAKLAWIQGEAAYDGALDFFEKALTLRRVHGAPGAIAQSLSNISNIHLQRGALRKADEGFREALELRRQGGDRAGEAISYVGLGAVRHAQRDFDGALGQWREGLAVAEQVGHRELQGILLNNIGEANLERGELEAAEKALADAREVVEDTGDQRTQVDVLRNTATLRFQQGRYDDALELADAAIEVAEAIKSRPTLGMALRTKGEILSQQLFADDTNPNAEAIEAVQCFDRAVKLFEKVGDSLELERTLRAYAIHLEERGAIGEAATMRQRAKRIKAKARRGSEGPTQPELPALEPDAQAGPPPPLPDAPPPPPQVRSDKVRPKNVRGPTGDHDTEATLIVRQVPLERARRVTKPREPAAPPPLPDDEPPELPPDA